MVIFDQVIERCFHQLCLFCRIESATNLEAIKQSYMDTLNELNQELLALKEAYEELDAEKTRPSE